MDGFRNGNIISLLVKDFQTFSKQKFAFGPSLNLIAAPNGSGKSSIANAIAFVFNGSPKTIGKSKDIIEFIRFGCTEAEISAEVIMNGSIVKLSRRISTSHSYYFVNNKLVTQKEYFKLLGDHKIDVNNLCTFLPQERVGEFSRMNPQELLIEVLKGSTIDLNRMKDLYNNLEEIISALSFTEKQKELMATTINILESNMKEIKEREANAMKLQKLEYKKSFLDYEAYKNQYLGIKRNLNALNLKIQENTVKISSYENNIKLKESDDAFIDYKKNVESLVVQNKELRRLQDALCSYILKFELLKVDKTTILNKANLREKNIKSKSKELGDFKSELCSIKDKMEKEIRDFKAKIQCISEDPEYESLIVLNSKLMSSETTGLDELELVIPSSRTIDDAIQGLRQSMGQIQHTSHQIQKQIEELEQQKINHSEHGNIRMEMLKKYHIDSYKGVLWLRENKHLFQDEILEPSYLHLNLDREYSDYVETFLSFQALSSFIVKNDNDFAKLTRILKDEMNLSINAAVLSSSKIPGLSRSNISKFGLDGVLSDFIECRPEYMDFLNSYGHFNSIPISKRNINEEDIFKNLSMVKRMAIENRYSEIKRSRYGNDYIIITNRLISRGLFVFSKIDVESINLQLSGLNKERERNKAKMESLLEEKVALDAKRATLKKEFDTSQISRLSFNAKRITENIGYVQSEITALQLLNSNSLIKKIDLDIDAINRDIQSETRRLYSLLDLENIPKFNLEKIKDLKLDLDNDKRQLLFIKHLREADNAAHDQLLDAKSIIRSKIEDLKSHITAFPKFDSLDGLPDAIPEIESEISFLKAKLAVCNDQSHIKEDYKEKENQLNNIFQSIDDLKKAQTLFETEFNNEKARTTNEIYDLLAPIDGKFRELFRKFNFDGKLELDTSKREWELKILVKFRDNESFQRLSSFRQSGGEKSLTTILFLLALQQCEDAPFRLVDEINQGMDPYNERMVFEILKEMSDKSQFFIITPKLVENLEFSDNTRAIIVYGGPGISKDLENYTQSILT